MSKKKDVGIRLMDKFDAEILKRVEKIVEEEANTGELDKILQYDYYGDVVVQIETPVLFKKSGIEMKIDRKYHIDIEIIIREPE